MTGLKDLWCDGLADGRLDIANALRGRAAIERISRAGVTRDGKPEVELVLRIDLPDREPYRATHRQVISRLVLHNLEPGSEASVTVDAEDPARLEIR
jgi:hypothetical protein